MKIQRALKVRIYPTQEQEQRLRSNLGSCRFIYNQMLAERIRVYEELKDDKEALKVFHHKTEKEWKVDFPWLKEAESTSLQQSRIDLEKAYSNFFKSLKGERKGTKVGFPKFKKRRGNESFRSIASPQCKSFLVDSEIRLAKIGNIQFKHRGIKDWYLTAEPKSITISKTASEKFFVSILFEGEQDFQGHQEISKDSKVIGLDMSMDKFYVDNLGGSPEYQRLYRMNEKKLAKVQKRLSRKTKGSKNRNKVRVRVARIHERIKNQRSDFIHQLSHRLIMENDVIVVEDLSLKGMSQALKLGKSVMDLGYSEFIRQLQYKALWNDKTLIKVDRWFASSKTCSFCGQIKKDLILSDRSWTCSNCGTTHDRDQNAGQNLRKEGFKILGLEESEVTPVEFNDPEEKLRLSLIMNDEAGNFNCEIGKSLIV